MHHLGVLAMASPPEGASGGASMLFTMMPILLMFLVLWFLILRPQKKQQQQRKTMLEGVKRGDKVITSGGLFATVKDVKQDRVVATIAEGVKVEISKQAISSVFSGQEE